VFDLSGAARGLAGALSQGGRLIWTAPFTELNHEGPSFRDFWRFTPLAAARLLAQAGLRVDHVEASGGGQVATAALLGFGIDDVPESVLASAQQPLPALSPYTSAATGAGSASSWQDGGPGPSGWAPTQWASYLGVHILATRPRGGDD